MQHIQMQGVRNQLSARGMALRTTSGKYEVTRRNTGATETFDNLEAAYYGGLRMALDASNGGK